MKREVLADKPVDKFRKRIKAGIKVNAGIIENGANGEEYWRQLEM